MRGSSTSNEGSGPNLTQILFDYTVYQIISLSKEEDVVADQQIKCEKCDREFSEGEAIEYPGKVHVHKGTIICENCLVDMGISPDEAQPYQTYINTRTEPGMSGI